MNEISIYSEADSGTTTVPNLFIDYYMPAANGTYVKVYLYLLRCLTTLAFSISLSAIADHLDETEKDILRALKYWEKEGVLALLWNENEIEGITLLQLRERDTHNPRIITDTASMRQTPSANNTVPVVQDTFLATQEETTSPQPATKATRPNYSPSQITQLSESEDVKFLLNTIELYLERFLTQDDIQLVLYIYESIGFSKELIIHLYDYCISKNKKSNAYIEKVALSWAEAGIDTVEKAEQATIVYESYFNAVNKAFALNRAPGNSERQFLKRWGSYNFPISLIEEACNRTLLQAGKPDFKYADKILRTWHEKGVTSLSDIAKLDEEHAKTFKKPAPQTINQTAPRPQNNRFNAFPQREYSKDDISSLEQRLLHRGTQS